MPGCRAIALLLCVALPPICASARAQEGPTGEQVKTAIARGVRYVLRQQNPDGGWNDVMQPGGVTALATLALLHAGEDRDEPHMQSAIKALRRADANGTYNLAGIKVASEKPLDGVSLKPLLTQTRSVSEGPGSQWPDRTLVTHWNGRLSLRTQQYRFDAGGGQGKKAAASPALFDMVADPGQQRDISKEQPQVAARDVGESGLEARQHFEIEELGVEVERGRDVVDHVADAHHLAGVGHEREGTAESI